MQNAQTMNKKIEKPGTVTKIIHRTIEHLVTFIFAETPENTEILF